MRVTQVQKDEVFEGSQGFRDMTLLENDKKNGEAGLLGGVPEDEVIASREINRHGNVESFKGFLREANIEAKEIGDHGGGSVDNGITGVKVFGVIEGDRWTGGNEITR